MSRVFVARAAVGAALLGLIGAATTVAHDPQNEVALLRQEVEELREQRNTLQDQLIEVSRRFDQEKKRLHEEKDQLAAELARLNAAKGGDTGRPPADDPLEARTVSFDLKDRPLAEAVAAINEAGKPDVKLRLDRVPAEARLHLRARDLPLGHAISLVAANARTPGGAWLELEHGEDEGGIFLRALRR